MSFALGIIPYQVACLALWCHSMMRPFTAMCHILHRLEERARTPQTIIKARGVPLTDGTIMHRFVPT